MLFRFKHATLPCRDKTQRTSLKPESEHWALPVQQERSRATRERILAAAEWAFAEKGYDGARISDIAKDAGCSVGAVYFRFKDKDALFFAIAETFAPARASACRYLAQAAFADAHEVIERFVTATASQFPRTSRACSAPSWSAASIIRWRWK